MNEFDFLQPINPDLIAEISKLHQATLGRNTIFHSEEQGVPELEDMKIAVFGVLETRRDLRGAQNFNLESVRRELYNLFPGNWSRQLADLGDIQSGETVEDTYFAVKQLISKLVKANVIPVMLGGSQDLLYAQYRSYDDIGGMVNLVNIDAQFDLGNSEEALSNKSYLGRIVMEAPYKLFNFSNLGYQTYFNSQEEIDLIEKLYFDAYRLGTVSNDVSSVEPVMRDADIVGLDINSLSSETIDLQTASPNGFSGREICTLARYAGISDRLSSFGIFQLHDLADSKNSYILVAQIIWYFIEGINYRKHEGAPSQKQDLLKYSVPIDEDTLIFYKSQLSERWWIEIPYSSRLNNKLENYTLLPCTHQDYLEACNQNIPERWWKTRRKNEL